MTRRIIYVIALALALGGFIDLHTHSDNYWQNDGTAQSKIRQGVTLDFIGEGGSVAPRNPPNPNAPAGRGGAAGGGGRGGRGGGPTWTDFNGYFAAAEKA